MRWARQEALRLSPNFVEVLVMLGVIELRRGHKELADAYYAQALKADPTFPCALHVYADMYHRQGDYGNALAYYKKTLERGPKNFEAIVQTRVTSQHLSDMQGALQYATRAAELRPDSWMPPYNAACIYTMQGDRVHALEHLRRAVANTISDSDLLVSDPDFASLRKDPEFIALASQAQASWHAVENVGSANEPTLHGRSRALWWSAESVDACVNAGRFTKPLSHPSTRAGPLSLMRSRKFCWAPALQ
jgi:tetratricopeptide (TPR) repeat protein